MFKFDQSYVYSGNNPSTEYVTEYNFLGIRSNTLDNPSSFSCPSSIQYINNKIILQVSGMRYGTKFDTVNIDWEIYYLG
jgi:hypothetical protein